MIAVQLDNERNDVPYLLELEKDGTELRYGCGFVYYDRLEQGGNP